MIHADFFFKQIFNDLEFFEIGDKFQKQKHFVFHQAKYISDQCNCGKAPI